MKPIRIQLSRAAGWRKPPNTIVVARPSRYGNCFKITPGHPTQSTAEQCVRLHKRLFTVYDGTLSDYLRVEALRKGIQVDLRGMNLACWCKLCPKHKDGKPLGVECDECAPCHADTLLEIANE